MVKWKPSLEFHRANLMALLLLTILSAFFIYVSSARFFDSPNATNGFFVFSSLLLIIYSGGKFYSFRQYKEDFIEISTEGISFRQTPRFGGGWLTNQQFFTFEDVFSISIVEQRNLWSDTTKKGVLLIPKVGKPIIIGDRYSENQIIKIGFAMQGSVKLAGPLKRLLGNPEIGDTLKTVISTAKGIWDAYKNSSKEQ